jgi:V8-like Glu-specific endopeptidase
MQQLLFCTSMVQIGNTAGTAFIFNAQSGSNIVPVLVTNKHVALVPGQGSFSLMANEADAPKLGERVEFSHPNFSALWTGHPSGNVDLAAAFLGPFINSAAAQGKGVFFRAVGEQVCPTAEIVENLDATEPIVFIGYPDALYDKANLTPIMRRGYTATPIALDYNGIPAFLIDASVFPGSSGSPVFIYQENYRDGRAIRLGASRLLFAGVVASVHTQKDVGQIVTNRAPTTSFNQLLDLGIVFNWRAVIETVANLFNAHGLPYGAPAPAKIQGQEAMEITTQDEPPVRPSAGV